MKIGFVGLGRMGTPMALRLIAAGHELSVWNRSEARTNPLVHEGAILAGTPAEAELGGDAVITMLSDDAAYEEVLFGPNGLFDAFSPGGLHISCSTISVALSQRLTAAYAERGVDFVAAPLFGTPNVAEEGRLWVVAGGANSAINRARPVLEGFARGITVVGNEPRQAHAAKLAGEFVAAAMLYSLDEALMFAAGQGIEREILLQAVNDGVLQSTLNARDGKFTLLQKDLPAAPDFGNQNLRLLREAATKDQIRLRLADLMSER